MIRSLARGVSTNLKFISGQQDVAVIVYRNFAKCGSCVSAVTARFLQMWPTAFSMILMLKYFADRSSPMPVTTVSCSFVLYDLFPHTPTAISGSTSGVGCGVTQSLTLCVRMMAIQQVSTEVFFFSNAQGVCD